MAACYPDGATVATAYYREVSKEIEILYSELFEAAGVGRRFGEELARGQGQTQARWQTMWTIDRDASLTVPQIARRLGVTRQSTQRVVDELVSDGSLVAVVNPDHKTSPLFRLTDTGRAVLEAIDADAAIAHQHILREFGADDVAQLRALLTSLSAITRSNFPV